MGTQRIKIATDKTEEKVKIAGKRAVTTAREKKEAEVDVSRPSSLADESEQAQLSADKRKKTPKTKPSKTRPAKIRGKKYLAVLKEVKKDEFYPLSEALELLKKTSYVKFDGTCEAHLNLLTKDVRGTTTLPHGTGKAQKIMEFKTESNAPVMHLAFGKVSWDKEKLEENLEALISAVGKNRIKKLVLSATMGPGIKVDLAAI